jgi:rod shape-determining protein MreC
MENVLKRHVNLVALAIALVAQIIGLAYQINVKRGNDSVRLIRVWTVGVIAPMEKTAVHTGNFFADTWHNYFYLRSVRLENERLSDENTRLRLEQVRLADDAAQAQRLKALLKFKEQYVSETLAAEVIGGSGSELSRVVYIDKGAHDGVKPDMAVINPTGVVGKVIRVFPTTSQVLEINDQTSGIGAILETTRLQGILKGNPSGDAQLKYVMSDETVKPGERVLTSGGDHIFPRGLPIGTVSNAAPGDGLFLSIRVKPTANLNRLEEVLVITKMSERDVEAPTEGPKRAADILAQRLPSVPVKAPEQPGAAGAPGTPGATGAAKPAGTGTTGTAKQNAPATTTKPAAKPTGTAGATGSAAATTNAGAGATPTTSATPKPKSTAGAGTATPGTTTTPAATPKKQATPPEKKPPTPDNKPQTETTPQ